MSRRPETASRSRRLATLAALAVVTLPAIAVNFPITPQQRGTAQQVAQAGVALSELAPNAPDSYTVKRGDTLWDISKIFLTTPWRWPELWGMNLQEIRNPHLIFPGQVLYLDKTGGRARLRLAQPVGDGKLSPRVRSSALGDGAIASVPFNLIEPFLTEAVVFNTNELAAAPRIVAAPEDRVLMGRGDVAYVRGELVNARDWRIFREPKPLVDPTTREILGYEAAYVGTAEYQLQGDESKPEAVPATFRVTSVKQEANVGDRLAITPSREYTNYAPHAPARPVAGQIVKIYGEFLTAGQNQIVALNKGAADGMERGHVLALWRDGKRVLDKTEPTRAIQPRIKLPDERHGTLFVFRTFERVSYALILSVQEPVKAGDRFTQP